MPRKPSKQAKKELRALVQVLRDSSGKTRGHATGRSAAARRRRRRRKAAGCGGSSACKMLVTASSRLYRGEGRERVAMWKHLLTTAASNFTRIPTMPDEHEARSHLSSVHKKNGIFSCTLSGASGYGSGYSGALLVLGSPHAMVRTATTATDSALVWGSWTAASNYTAWSAATSGIQQYRLVGGCCTLEYMGPRGASMGGIVHLLPLTYEQSQELTTVTQIVDHPMTTTHTYGDDIVLPLPVVDEAGLQYISPGTTMVQTTCWLVYVQGIPLASGGPDAYQLSCRTVSESMMDPSYPPAVGDPMRDPVGAAPGAEAAVMDAYTWMNKVIWTAGAVIYSGGLLSNWFGPYRPPARHAIRDRVIGAAARAAYTGAGAFAGAGAMLGG